MLRRRPDNRFEYRDIERALYRMQPPSLAPERRDALRARVMASLGEQEALRRAGILTPDFGDRWVAVPAGVGLAAAIIAGIYAHRHLEGGTGTSAPAVTFAGELQFDGAPVGELRPGPTFVAAAYTQVSLGDQVVVLLERGASFSFASLDGDVTVYPSGGRSTVVTGGAPTHVIGKGWSARLGVDAAAEFAVSERAVAVTGQKGVTSVTDAAGATHALAAGKVLTIRLGEEPAPLDDDLLPGDPGSGQGPSEPPAGGVGPGARRDGDDESAGSAASGPVATPPGTPVVALPAGGSSTPETQPPAAPDERPAPAVRSTPEGEEAPTEEGEGPDEAAEGTPPGPPEGAPPGHGGDIPGDPPASPAGGPDDPSAGPPSGGGEGNGNGNAFGPGGNGNGNGNAFGPDGNGNGNANGAGDGETGATSNGTPVEGGPGNGNGNGNAFGHAMAPGQQMNADEAAGQGNGNGPGSNNGNAETNPGKGKGPAKK